jgi:hypothetical protein
LDSYNGVKWTLLDTGVTFPLACVTVTATHPSGNTTHTV